MSPEELCDGYFGESCVTYVSSLHRTTSYLISLTTSYPGPNKHTMTQINDAIHDGLRAVKNAMEDGSVVPGAGAFEVAAHAALTSAEFMNSVQGRAKYGIKVRFFTSCANQISTS